MKFSMKDSFSKCDQIRRKLQVEAYLLLEKCTPCTSDISFLTRFLKKSNLMYFPLNKSVFRGSTIAMFVTCDHFTYRHLLDSTPGLQYCRTSMFVNTASVTVSFLSTIFHVSLSIHFWYRKRYFSGIATLCEFQAVVFVSIVSL